MSRNWRRGVDLPLHLCLHRLCQLSGKSWNRLHSTARARPERLSILRTRMARKRVCSFTYRLRIADVQPINWIMKQKKCGRSALHLSPKYEHIHSRSIADEKQAELAPSKPRITKLKQWLVEALEGIPPEMVGREQEMSTSARERIRKYRVSTVFHAGC